MWLALRELTGDGALRSRVRSARINHVIHAAQDARGEYYLPSGVMRRLDEWMQPAHDDVSDAGAVGLAEELFQIAKEIITLPDH
jgi:hypothetical protein